MYDTNTIDAKTLGIKLLYPFDDIRAALDRLYLDAEVGSEFLKALDIIRISTIEAIRYTHKAAETYKAGDYVMLRHMQHDILAPSATMLSYCYFVLEGLVGNVTPAYEKLFMAIIYRTHHVRRQIINLIDYACLRALPVEASLPLALHTLLTPKLVMMPRSNSVVWDVPEDLPQVNAIRRYIANSVTNLVVNALQASKSGIISVTARATNQLMTIKVQDTGKGIAADCQPLLCKPFYQIKSKSDQLGLGLTVASKQIEAQGSLLKIESIEKHGTTASFQIPTLLKR